MVTFRGVVLFRLEEDLVGRETGDRLRCGSPLLELELPGSGCGERDAARGGDLAGGGEGLSRRDGEWRLAGRT